MKEMKTKKVVAKKIKSFDEVMNAIKKENYNELKKTCEHLEGIEKEIHQLVMKI